MSPMSSNTPRRSLHALPPGTVLHDYVIDSELGSGGFSIVYLARHRLNSDWLFAIKEFLPRELAVRYNDGASVHPVDTEAKDAFEDGLRRFRDEAEQLRKFRNEPYIVSCLNYFEQNGTSYLVMDYDDGLPLSEFLRRREAAGQPFTEKDLLAVVEPLLEGLTVVHGAGVLHRDIKPGNIFVRRHDDITGRPAHPVLIDFGAAKQNYLARHSRSRAPYTPGYAAYEQVSSMGEIGPWTDLYSLGAVMWRMVAGGCPDDSRLFVPDESNGIPAEKHLWNPSPREVEKRAYALNRGWSDPMPPAVELGAGRFSTHVLETIDRCLAQYPEDRVQDCEKLSLLLRVQQAIPVPEPPKSRREAYSGTSGSATGVSRRPKTPQGAKDKPERRGPVVLTWLSIVVVVLVAIGVRTSNSPEGSTQPADTPLPPQEQQVATIEEVRGALEEIRAAEAITAYEQRDYRAAFEGFRNLAEQGNALAQNYLGIMYTKGEGTATDLVEALRWWNRAAEQDFAAAQYNIGNAYDFARGVDEDKLEAVRWYRRAAEQGYAPAQGNLGYMYAVGEGVVEDDSEAVRWLLLAAEQGDVFAQLYLGYMYAVGEGVVEDDSEAVRWYRLAAEQGLADAQHNLGIKYAVGDGVVEDDAEAVRWYRLAAEQGLADAQHNLGIMYAVGDGVVEDDAEAVRWYRLAAEQGLANAQYSLGRAFAVGEGVPEDDIQAVRWWRLAAEQGLGDAQYNLGRAYSRGEGVPEDDEEAVRWWRLAAEQGLADAQYAIGLMYANGEGVAQDLVESYAWHSVAEAQGHTFARNSKGSVAIRMSQSQIEEAQELSGEYWTMYVEPFL